MRSPEDHLARRQQSARHERRRHRNLGLLRSNWLRKRCAAWCLRSTAQPDNARAGPVPGQYADIRLWLHSLAISLSFVRPEYPDKPSSLARFFGCGIVQSAQDPALPPSRPTAEPPEAADALEIRAAFSLDDVDRDRKTTRSAAV